jgi:hypothetical protein
MTTYPVRCCCQPTKIFGYIDVPAGAKTHFEVLSFVPSTPIWDHKNLEPVPAAGSVEQHTIEIRPIKLENMEPGEYELAVYSDDRPIEFWRKIRGFHEYYGPFQ